MTAVAALRPRCEQRLERVARVRAGQPGCCSVARPATRSRLLLWAPVAPEQQSRTVADREATRLVMRETGSDAR